MSNADDYILSHSNPEPEGLQWIRRQTYLQTNHYRMLSGPIQGHFLTMLCRFAKVERALEIGTFSGYSSACIAMGLPDGGHLDTLEINDEMEELIREGWRRCGVGDKITLHIADARDTLQTLQKEFKAGRLPAYDLAYIDGNKREYREYLEGVLPMMRKGGLILADNTLWDGKILQEPLPVDAQTREIVAFNDEVAKDGRFEAVMLPLRDGLSVLQVL